MVAAKKRTTDDRVHRMMCDRYQMYFVELVGRLRRYANPHAECYVEIVGDKVTTFTFHETMDLSRPAIDPIPGA